MHLTSILPSTFLDKVNYFAPSLRCMNANRWAFSPAFNLGCQVRCNYPGADEYWPAFLTPPLLCTKAESLVFNLKSRAEGLRAPSQVVIKEGEEWCDGGGRRSGEEVLEAGGLARWLAELWPFHFPQLISLVSADAWNGQTSLKQQRARDWQWWPSQQFKMHLPFFQRKDVIGVLVDLT